MLTRQRIPTDYYFDFSENLWPHLASIVRFFEVVYPFLVTWSEEGFVVKSLTLLPELEDAEALEKCFNQALHHVGVDTGVVDVKVFQRLSDAAFTPPMRTMRFAYDGVLSYRQSAIAVLPVGTW